MKMEDLLDLVKLYYPKNHLYSVDLLTYVKTKEYQRLERLHESLVKQRPDWDNRISKLNMVCKTNFYPLMPNHMDRCLSYQMKVSDQYPDVRITLDISGLGDFFSLRLLKRVVSKDVYEVNGKDLDAMRQMRKLTSYVFIETIDEYIDPRIIKIVQQYIEEKLKLVKLETNQLNHVIKDYEFDNGSELFTLYTALFTSDPIIQ